MFELTCQECLYNDEGHNCPAPLGDSNDERICWNIPAYEFYEDFGIERPRRDIGAGGSVYVRN